MMAKIILFFISIVFFSLSSVAQSNNETQEEEKKSTKVKYNFNVFKLVTIDSKHEEPTDSTKIETTNLPNKKEL